MPPSPDAARDIRLLQDDLATLLRHVIAAPARPGEAADDDRAGLQDCARVMTLDPVQIAGSPELLAQLLAALKRLSRLAAPADLWSIRLTQAFLGLPEGATVPAAVERAARRLRRWAAASAVFGLLVFTVTMLLLVHVDRGRRTVEQLKAVRAEYQSALDNLGVAELAASARTSGPDGVGCPAAPGAGAMAGSGPAALQLQLICTRVREAEDKLRLVYRELSLWNTVSQRLSLASPVAWLQPRAPDPPDTVPAGWQSTDLRTSVLINGLTGVVMPTLLGLLGACAYVYREIDEATRCSTLASREALHGTLRILLGGILGGLLGAIWTDNHTFELQGVSLSLAALAFFVGFSVEVVFRMLDVLILAVADRIGRAAR
ncbi:MAG: hypothetical protein RQ966_04545 [Acetobacteraceae bacterium]|nr:hypothetical protein [Acetobacteraceae bacterium]